MITKVVLHKVFCATIGAGKGSTQSETHMQDTEHLNPVHMLRLEAYLELGVSSNLVQHQL